VVARLIHGRSPRGVGRLQALNCAGVPDSLLESELFGHVRGAFTGAYRDKAGLLELAHGGTAFMDEVGEMSLRMQAVLLRFLETGEIRRVGADRPQARVDVRVIAATNRNLQERIASREFREDLFYRLDVIHIAMPPLRERREDVPDLLEHFFAVYSERQHVQAPQLSPGALARLVHHSWPGNVRELKNVVQRMMLRHSTGGAIMPADLPPEIVPAPPKPLPEHPRVPLAQALLDEIVQTGASFWTVVHDRFMARDLTRDDLRAVIRLGLECTQGSYRLLVELFNLPPADHRRLLSFLRKYDCQVPVQDIGTLRPAKAGLGKKESRRETGPG
jgi:transcriptional regulator with PAS, ATPase and Fis domain